MGAALAMAEGTSSVGSAGRADKATVAASEALGPRAYGRAGGGSAKGLHMARPSMGSTPRKGERAPVESERMRGAPTGWARRGGIRQDTGRMRPSEGHSPLETIEEGNTSQTE